MLDSLWMIDYYQRMFLRRRSRVRRYAFRLILLAIAVVGIALAVYFYREYDKTKKLLKDPTRSAQVEQENLVAKVGKLIELPTDEQPSIATVSDATKLQNQPFFAKAKNGYKVLIYQNAKRAILYDPQRNKIIEVGPINMGQATPSQPPQTPTVSQAPISVALYNGTKTAGLAGIVEKQLLGKISNITIVTKANTKLDYAKTIVVDLSGKNRDTAFQLAGELGGQVGSLPKGETAPSSTDVLVILGK